MPVKIETGQNVDPGTIDPPKDEGKPVTTTASGDNTSTLDEDSDVVERTYNRDELSGDGSPMKGLKEVPAEVTYEHQGYPNTEKARKSAENKARTTKAKE